MSFSFISTKLRLLVFFLWVIVIFPLCTLFCVLRWKHPDNMKHSMRVISRGGTFILGVKMIIENLEGWEKFQPCIYLGNHQSGLDVLTYGYNQPKAAVGIGKKELLWVPFFGLFFLAAGNIFIDRKNRARAVKSLKEAADKIRGGLSIGMYPEGTRNKEMQGLLPFKKGAFHLAIDAQVPLVPLVSSPQKLLYDPRTGYFRGGTIIIRALDPIPTKGLTRDDIDSLSDRARSIMLEALSDLETRAKVLQPL